MSINKKKIDGYTILGYLSILIIIVCIVYFGLRLTGITGNAVSTDTAVVNVTISTTTAINFTTDFINFGTGSVNTGFTSATIDTEGTVTDGSWTPLYTNFTLENIGNTNVNLTLKVGKTAAQFIGGTSPAYQFKFSNKEATSCTNSTATGVWAATSTSDISLCSMFNSADVNDTINIGIKLAIPSDSFTGTQTDTFTATATSI
jgi:hypothetical protein